MPQAVAMAAAPLAPRAAPPPPRPAPSGSGARVQLVAAGSEAEAMRHWARFAQQAPDLAEGHQPLVSEVERPGQSAVWRLRVGGFAGAEEAQRWCARLRERGIACWVAS